MPPKKRKYDEIDRGHLMMIERQAHHVDRLLAIAASLIGMLASPPDRQPPFHPLTAAMVAMAPGGAPAGPPPGVPFQPVSPVAVAPAAGAAAAAAAGGGMAPPAAAPGRQEAATTEAAAVAGAAAPGSRDDESG